MAPKAEKVNVVTSLDTTKKSIFMMDPAQVLIVGVDFGGPGDQGYDERIKLPLDQQMVDSIKKFGVIRTVIARKDGERAVALDGRRRIMHARAANLQLQADNPGIAAENLIRIPTEFKRGDEITQLSTSRIANAYAVKDSPLSEAKHMQQAIDKGASVEDVALMFGVGVVTVGDRIKLLDLAPEAAKLVEAEILTTNAALELTGIPMAEQVKVLQRVRDESVTGKGGKLNTKAVTEAVREVRQTTGQGTATRKTPSEKCKGAVSLIEALALEHAKGKDVKSPPDRDAMFATLRKLTLLLVDKKWESVVKSLIPKEEAEEAA